MKTTTKLLATMALVATTLAGCGSGLVGDTPDGFFQVQDTPVGNVCVNNFYPDPLTGEDKLALDLIWKYYKGDARLTRTTYSDQGIGANCNNQFKPHADVIISREFYDANIASGNSMLISNQLRYSLPYPLGSLTSSSPLDGEDFRALNSSLNRSDILINTSKSTAN